MLYSLVCFSGISNLAGIAEWRAFCEDVHIFIHYTWVWPTVCKSGVSFKCSHVNMPYETWWKFISLLLRRSWSWFLERSFFREVFEGSFPARRKNWMEISVLWVLSQTFSFTVRKEWELCSWLEYLREVVHAEIGEWNWLQRVVFPWTSCCFGFLLLITIA